MSEYTVSKCNWNKVLTFNRGILDVLSYGGYILLDKEETEALYEAMKEYYEKETNDKPK